MNVVSQSSQPSAGTIYRPQYPRKKARVTKVTKKTYTKVSKGELAIAVRKELDKMAETKQATYVWNQLDANSLGNYTTGAGIWGVANVAPFFPQTAIPGYIIAQGTGQGNRVGNSVRTHKLMYKGVIYPSQYNATYNAIPIPQEVMFLLFSRKDTGDQFLSTTAALYQNGSNSSNPTGQLTDLIQDFNLDLYNIHYKRIFKLGYAENVGTGAAAGRANYATNDFKYNCKFAMDLTKYIDKVIKFNDGSNFAVGMKNFIFGAWFPCNADGSAAVANYRPVSMTSNIIYRYKDV